MKKWTKLGIGLLCATLVTFGVRSISGVSNADEASQTVNGTVETIDAAHGEVTVSTDDGTEKTVPLSKTVWVFLDDHKAQASDLGKGFKVDLILNGKKQVAYIKAISNTVTGKSGSAQAPVGTTDLVTASSSAPAAATASATVEAPTTGTSPTASSTPAQTAAPWDKLHIKIEGNGFTMDIQDKGDHNNGMSMIKMKPKGRDSLFLKGDDAEHWIRTLLAGIDLKAPNAQQQIKTAFINWFDLYGNTLNVNIEVEAKPAAVAATTSSAPAAASGTTNAPASTPATPSITPEASSGAPAVPSTTSIPAVKTVKAQITISSNNDDDGEENDDDNEDNQDHDKQSKDDHKKVEKVKIKEKEHQDNGKHKDKGDKDD
jgi:hypothetical protein